LDEVEPGLGPRDFAADIKTLAGRVGEFESLMAHDGAALDDCLRRAGTFVFHARRGRGLIERGE
jgi:hypothetical protein